MEFSLEKIAGLCEARKGERICPCVRAPGQLARYLRGLHSGVKVRHLREEINSPYRALCGEIVAFRSMRIILPSAR